MQCAWRPAGALRALLGLITIACPVPPKKLGCGSWAVTIYSTKHRNVQGM